MSDIWKSINLPGKLQSRLNYGHELWKYKHTLHNSFVIGKNPFANRGIQFFTVGHVLPSRLNKYTI